MVNSVINLPQKIIDVALEEGEMLVGKTNKMGSGYKQGFNLSQWIEVMWSWVTHADRWEMLSLSPCTSLVLLVYTNPGLHLDLGNHG